jgi:hypothetical protein
MPTMLTQQSGCHVQAAYDHGTPETVALLNHLVKLESASEVDHLQVLNHPQFYPAVITVKNSQSRDPKLMNKLMKESARYRSRRPHAITGEMIPNSKSAGMNHKHNDHNDRMNRWPHKVLLSTECKSWLAITEQSTPKAGTATDKTPNKGLSALGVFGGVSSAIIYS